MLPTSAVTAVVFDDRLQDYALSSTTSPRGGDAHTYDSDGSVDPSVSEVSNRFFLQLTSIVEESELPANVCYNVEDIPHRHP